MANLVCRKCGGQLIERRDQHEYVWHECPTCEAPRQEPLPVVQVIGLSRLSAAAKGTA